MRFDLRVPCIDCPFRREGGCRIGRGHAAAIVDMMLEQGAGGCFPCHKTTEATGQPPGREQHCAGALIFAELRNRRTQAMQIAQRIGWYFPELLSGAADLFGSVEELLEAQFPD